MWQFTLARVAPRARGSRGGTRGLIAAGALIAAAALTGCGSSSTPTTTTTAASRPAAGAHLVVIHSVPAPAGAATARAGSLTRLAVVHKGSGVTPHIVGVSSQTTLQGAIHTLDVDLSNFWSGLFAQAKIQWPATYEAFIGTEPVQTHCSAPAPQTLAGTDPFLLCNHTFFWTLPWIEKNIVPQGEVALAFDVAMTWSFQVQIVLGYTSAVEQGKMTKGEYGNQNLCLTGLWVRSLSQRNLLESGDAQAAEKLLASLTGVFSITAPDVTQQSLSQAFFAGYNSGNPATCVPAGSGGTSTASSETTPTTTSGYGEPSG